MGLKLEGDLETNTHNRTEECNPQTLWKKYKDNLIRKTRDRVKIAIPKIEGKFKQIQAQLETTIYDQNLPDNKKFSLLQ